MIKITKIAILPAFALAVAFVVACGGDGAGEPRNFLLFHPDPALEGTDQTELTDVTGALIFGRFNEVTDNANAGWATYRWRECKTNDGDLDGYKISYLERATDNVYVGSGICLNADNPNVVDVNDGVGRIERLRELVDDAVFDANSDTSADLSETCRLRSEQAESIGREFYLFGGTIGDSTSLSTCHPRPEILGADLYGLRDDFGRNYLEDAIADLDANGDHWSAYQFPKLGEPNTPFADPPKLSYFVATDDGEHYFGSGIYLDVNNPTLGGQNGRLEDTRDRVQAATALIQSEGLDDALAMFRTDPRFTDAEMGEAYLFVWENR